MILPAPRGAGLPTVRAGLAVAAFTVAAVALAYQLMRPIAVDLGSVPAAVLTTRGLYAAEDGYRWTTGRGAIVLPGPGPGRRIQVQATVSAWRPRGTPAPQLRLGVGGAAVAAQPGGAPVTVTLVTTTDTAWRDGVELRLDSETFAPGRGDPRTLGVRVHAVRLESATGALAPGLPPLVPVLWAIAAAQLAFWVSVAAGRTSGTALAAGFLATVGIALGLALARAGTVWLLPGLVFGLAAVLTIEVLLPSRARAAWVVLREAAGRLAAGVRAMEWRPLAGLVVLAAAGSVIAYRVHPVLLIPMASGRETAFERGLGSLDSLDGVRFRHLAAPAELDLRDLGGGEWRIAVAAAVEGAPRPVPLVDPGSGAVEGRLGPEWTVVETGAHAPAGWRSGLVLAFPGAPRDDIRIREVRIDRGRASPPLGIVAAVIAAGLLLFVTAIAGGLDRRAAWAIAAAAVVLEIVALGVDPVAAIPDMRRLAWIALLGACVTAIAGAVLSRPRRDGEAAALPAAAIVAGGIGFMAWLAATTTSLYRGGHFVFHSSIAEEIWKGSFLLYYLPYPGSMLSQQAQWGNVVVPHPALYHTLVSPLAALPRPAFFAAEKVLLALLLAAMVWASAALAARAGPPGSAAAAAILMASMPASFQLLGLGHLMTILGCWAMTMAVTYLALGAERLEAWPQWWRAVLLLTLCFLAYFAGLLFMAMVIAISAAAFRRRDPRLARALCTAALAASAIAFALYYVHWTWPFLSESVPRLLGGSGAHSNADSGALPSRLFAVPHKLAYTFGSALVPVLGLAGLVIARRGPPRVLLLAWAAILPVFSGLDLLFNFLLKHHYFTMVPVAVGGGVLLATLAERGRWGRGMALLALVVVALLGARVGLDAATGRIP